MTMPCYAASPCKSKGHAARDVRRSLVRLQVLNPARHLVQSVNTAHPTLNLNGKFALQLQLASSSSALRVDSLGHSAEASDVPSSANLIMMARFFIAALALGAMVVDAKHSSCVRTLILFQAKLTGSVQSSRSPRPQTQGGLPWRRGIRRIRQFVLLRGGSITAKLHRQTYKNQRCV